MKSDAGKFVHLVTGEQEKWSDGFCFLCNWEVQSSVERERKVGKSVV